MGEYEPKTPPAAVTPWIEKWLLGLMITLILLFGVLLIAGSAPARRTEQITRDSSTLLCFRVRDQMANDRAAGRPIDPRTEVAFRDICRPLLERYNGGGQVLKFALIPTGALLAQASATDPWVDSLLKGGPFAIVLLLIIMDKIGTHGERDRLRSENTELREEIRELNKSLREDVAPLLKSNTDTMKQYVEYLEREREMPRRRQRSVE